ncbi:MAG: hypothetical protein HOV81_17560 [Kofleriaceae bacterium]|nr:hypothetical protein [Kofleriaceae bacterium]
MRKIAIVAALALAVATPRSAHAACRLGPCPVWLDVIGYTLAAGIVGGYAYGTGTFIYRDMNDQADSLNYGMAEIGANGLLTFMFGAGMIESARNHNAGATVLLGGFTALHTTLTIHGIETVAQYRSEFRAPMASLPWVLGSVYGVNTAIWVGQLGDTHGRGYGAGEFLVNAPIAAGLGYLAYDRFSTGRGGPGLLYGGLGAVSGALALHGLKTWIAPTDEPPQKGLDLLGTDVMPTMVSDGIELAPGLGAAGTF